MCSGICTWITSAPQSASWRAAVGPARTWVRSRTRKRDKAGEAGMWGMTDSLLKLGLLVQSLPCAPQGRHEQPRDGDREQHHDHRAHEEKGPVLVEEQQRLLERLLDHLAQDQPHDERSGREAVALEEEAH